MSEPLPEKPLPDLSFRATTEKPYWHWWCGGCGHDDNRNSNSECAQCGKLISCDAAGGHLDFDGDKLCDRGCGYSFK